MKKILLSQELYAIVDDDIYNYLMQWKWHAARTKDGRIYIFQIQKKQHLNMIKQQKNIMASMQGQISNA